MHLHHRSLRLVALAVVVALPMLGLSGVASAQKAKTAASKCIKHPNRAKCLNGGGSSASGGGTGPSTGGPISVQIDPTPVVETGSSFVDAIVQVEASPSFANDDVSLSSAQFQASCQLISFGSFSAQTGSTASTLIMTLDNDGNGTAILVGEDCAPGSSVVEADLTVAPFSTALGTIVVSPPAVTAPGVFAYPTTSGTVTTGEVETGDFGTERTNSDVLALFSVETDPVYAEAQVEISSAQLESRCIFGYEIASFNQPGAIAARIPPGTNTGPEATATLDDDGNAVFVVEGGSCAPGPSEVIADVLAGTDPTYTTTFTIDPPQPTI
jgi:uncharacterized membrane protein